jgi:cysteine desulfurase
MIYLDNHATTRVDPAVLAEMLPWFSQRYGNPSSRGHALGWDAEEAVGEARARVAALLSARPEEIVFTSGATESNNLALKGTIEAAGPGPHHVITAVTEHEAVLDPCRWLADRGVRVTVLPVLADGLVDVAALESAFSADTRLVSIMAANNEIGTLQPLEEIGRLCRTRGILFHSDIAQAAGKVPVDLHAACIDLASISGHKLHAPKGVGALFVRKGVRPAPQVHGGGHESGIRSGTLNVPGIVGLGKACELSRLELESPPEGGLLALRERLWALLQARIPRIHLNGSSTRRLPGNLNVSFDCLKAESLLMQLEGELALSTGSACSSTGGGPSHVLTALGLPPERIDGAVRMGLGRFNTADEVDRAAELLAEAVARLRALSPNWK